MKDSSGVIETSRKISRFTGFNDVLKNLQMFETVTEKFDEMDLLELKKKFDRGLHTDREVVTNKMKVLKNDFLVAAYKLQKENTSNK